LAAQPLGHDDLELDEVIAAATAVQARQPEPAKSEALAGLGAGGNLELALAVQGRHGHRPAEHRARRRDPDLGEQVLPVALEALVGVHLDLHVQIAGRGPGLARVPRAADADALPGLDARRDLDVPRAGARHPPVAAADLAGLLGDPPVPATRRAGRRAHHLPERRAGRLADGALPGAGLAGADRRAGLGAVAAAVVAGDDRLKGDLPAGPGEHLLEVDRHAHADVGARRRAAAPAEPEDVAERGVAAEERVEDVLDAAERLGAGRPPARAQALVTVAVVRGAALGIGEHLVGLGSLLESLL